MKSLIGENIWTGFDDKKFDVPLVYYTDSFCYVTNPTERFVSHYNPEFIFRNSDIAIYKMPFLDSILFHMNVLVSFDDDGDYNYKLPFMLCSSVEITNKLVPDVPSTEVWATMVLHEYFHGFQFKHKKFFDYFEQNIALATQDTLKNLYSNNKWFKESIDRENDLLLSAISSRDKTETESLIKSFFQLREQRRKDTK